MRINRTVRTGFNRFFHRGTRWQSTQTTSPKRLERLVTAKRGSDSHSTLTRNMTNQTLYLTALDNPLKLVESQKKLQERILKKRSELDWHPTQFENYEQPHVRNITASSISDGIVTHPHELAQIRRDAEHGRTVLSQLSMQNRLDIVRAITQEIREGILYETGPLKKYIHTIVPPQIDDCKKTRAEVLTAELEFVGVSLNEICSWERVIELTQLPCYRFEPITDINMVQAPSNFVPLAGRQVFNNFVSGIPTIVKSHPAIRCSDFAMTHLLSERFQAHLEKKHHISPFDSKSTLQYVLTDNKGTLFLLNTGMGLHFTGSNPAAQIQREKASILVGMNAECGSRANGIIISQQAILESVNGELSRLDESSVWRHLKTNLIDEWTYAAGQQCTSLGMLGIIGSEEFFRAVTVGIKAMGQELSLDPSNLRETTSLPDFSLKQPSSEWILKPKETRKGVFSPGVLKIDPTVHPNQSDQKEYWHSTFNVARFKHIDDYMTFHRQFPALSRSLWLTPQEEEKALDSPRPMDNLYMGGMAAKPELFEFFGGSSENGTAIGSDAGPVGSPETPSAYVDITYTRDCKKSTSKLKPAAQKLFNKMGINIKKYRQAMRFLGEACPIANAREYNFAKFGLNNRVVMVGISPKKTPTIFRIENREELKLSVFILLGMLKINPQAKLMISVSNKLKKDAVWRFFSDFCTANNWSVKNEKNKDLVDHLKEIFDMDSLYPDIVIVNYESLDPTSTLGKYITQTPTEVISCCSRDGNLKIPQQLARMVMTSAHKKVGVRYATEERMKRVLESFTNK